ncbi:uncharacterized protein LOC132934396 [Metopolophium dirhodum]|uniref:uncharacterized protein LOC132934396 n=1 Tax=Metopolophium dirhodum TaxID=44670 RepID=UPI00298F5F66|nr:uncharacterized protein LOC132934396 [Metopolophium dirhodum]
MKSERISGTIESSSSEVNESSNSPKSCNDSGSQKAMSFVASTYGGGDDPISVETSKVVDQCAGESPRARLNSQRFIDDGDDVIIDEQTEIENKMSERFSDEDRPRSTDRPTVENDSGFDRYDAKDSGQSFCADGDRDCDDSSLTSSWLLGTDEIITGRRIRPSPNKRVAAVTTAVKGRKKRNPALGRKKALARLRGSHSAENGNKAEGLSSSFLPLPPNPIPIVDSGKYFENASVAPSRQQREKQIKDAYAAPEENNRTSAAAMARRTTDRCHEASSLINRRMGNREITRTNKIIVDKILNVRTTIPKTKK